MRNPRTDRKRGRSRSAPVPPAPSDADRMLRGLPLESGEAQPVPARARPLH